MAVYFSAITQPRGYGISTFDYIIVGGGSAGCALAGRLSENPSASVCLVEAGPNDHNWRVRTPAVLVNLMRNPRYNWMYESAPQQRLDNRRIPVPRGKTLGGSSSINSMVYIRGRPSDYDDWAGRGCKGWNWDAVLPYFTRTENNLRIHDAYHGNGGPLFVSDLPSPHPLCERWIAAGEAVGIPRNNDFNGENQEGLGVYQVTMKNGRRWSSADAYLSSARLRKNLTILTNAEATRIEFKGFRATRLSIDQLGKPLRLTVRKELLVCAGAIGSPALLLASGVGPAETLADIRVPIVNALDGVGQNLQEHVSIGISAVTTAGRGLSLATLPAIAWSPLRYALRGTGLMTTNHVEAGGFARTKPGISEPDVQFHFIPARVGVNAKGIVWGRGYFADVCLLKPKSRGQVTLVRNGNAITPSIDYRALEHPDDRSRIVDAFRLLRSIMHSDPLQALGPIEDSPGAGVQSDEQIFAHCKRRLGTAYHPVGTCRMGAADDPNTVVDFDLRVLGLDNVRVVDASIMPEIIAGNTNAPTMMIAEVASDKIRGQQPAL